MPATVIVGAQWGDEGKGKITDLLAEQVSQFEPVIELPGLDEYKRLFAPKLRDYQKTMVQFLALRAYAINGDPRNHATASRRVVGWPSRDRAVKKR